MADHSFRAGAAHVPGLALLAAFAAVMLPGTQASAQREVLPGITTDRVVLGEPYELLGNRMVFTNWYYVDPGDLDWRDDTGKSVYVHGDSDLFGAHHVGIRPPRGIMLRAEKPTVLGPLDMPYRTILKDGDVYKGWTSSEYYESADGLAWEKKANLVLDALHEDGVNFVFIDPVAPPEERFKAVWVGHLNRAQFDEFRSRRPDGWEPKSIFLLGEQDTVTCVRGSVSPDGITWTTRPDPLMVEYCDTLNTAYYDMQLKKYVIYTRFWSVGPTAAGQPVNIRGSWTGVGRRAIGRTESDDFRTFKPSEMILEPPPSMLPSEQLYTNGYTTVPGAPDQHLMFPTVWNASIDDTTRITMASSHDGRVWHWLPGGDLLETQAFGRWDGGCIWTHPNLIELGNGDWGLPYLGHNVPHKYPRGIRSGGVGYAVWPKGRLVALEAEDEGGFMTIPVMPKGKLIKINAVTKRTGWIKVGVAGDSERALEHCTPLVGDLHWTPLSWGGNTEAVRNPDQPVRLQVEMYQASLYGLEFE